MRQALCTSLLLLATAATAQPVPPPAAAPPAVREDVEQELRAIEERRRAAIKAGDFAALEQIYAADFSGIVGNGQVIDREQLFAVFKRTDPRMTFTTDEIQVRVFGDAALFTGRLTGRTPDGQTATAGRFSHLFVRRDGRWQCVAGQSTPIPGA